MLYVMSRLLFHIKTSDINDLGFKFSQKAAILTGVCRLLISAVYIPVLYTFRSRMFI